MKIRKIMILFTLLGRSIIIYSVNIIYVILCIFFHWIFTKIHDRNLTVPILQWFSIVISEHKQFTHEYQSLCWNSNLGEANHLHHYSPCNWDNWRRESAFTQGNNDPLASPSRPQIPHNLLKHSIKPTFCDVCPIIRIGSGWEWKKGVGNSSRKNIVH